MQQLQVTIGAMMDINGIGAIDDIIFLHRFLHFIFKIYELFYSN